MEFNIHLKQPQPDLAAVESALLSIDPAAVLDMDRAAGKLRVSSCATETELISMMANAGHAIEPGDIERLPSVCCGGCSG